MSDILCPNCCEPWDPYYLKYDLPFEAATTAEDLELILEMVEKKECVLKIPCYRARLKEAGWTFAGSRSMLFIKTCGSCKANKRGKILSIRVSQMDDIEALIGHDEDGAQSELEAWNSYE